MGKSKEGNIVYGYALLPTFTEDPACLVRITSYNVCYTKLLRENKRDKDKPFFLMHHFKAPHGMFEYAERYNDYLEEVEIPEPGNLYNQPGEYFGSVATRGVNEELVGVIGSTISPQTKNRITSYNVCYTKLLRSKGTVSLISEGGKII